MALCLWLHIKFGSVSDAYISIIGSIASLGGIVIAVWQIRALRNKTEAVSVALQDAREEMANLTIFAEINKHSQFINEIQQYLRNGKYSEALITYKDLKEKLSVLSGYIRDKDNYRQQQEDLKQLVEVAGGDIKTINGRVSKNNMSIYAIDTTIIIDNLENIKTFLDNTAGMLKGRKI